MPFADFAFVFLLILLPMAWYFSASPRWVFAFAFDFAFGQEPRAKGQMPLQILLLFFCCFYCLLPGLGFSVVGVWSCPCSLMFNYQLTKPGSPARALLILRVVGWKLPDYPNSSCPL